MKLETLDTVKARCTMEGDCWLWPASSNQHGKPEAPKVRHGGKVVKVRRVVRELVDGRPIPGRLEAVARCDNLRCVSPECSIKVSTKRSRQIQIERGHLNTPAAIAKRTATRRAASRFPEEVIAQVRNSPDSCAKAAAKAGMSKGHAHAVRTGQWRARANNPFAGLLA